MSAFTPGPWELWDGCSWRRFGSYATGQAVVEPTVHPRDGHPDLRVSKADARLICAAPELLAACQAAVEELESVAGQQAMHDDSWHPTRDLLIAAIAKATGEA